MLTKNPGNGLLRLARVAVARVPQAHQELGEVGGGAVVAAVGGHDALRGVRRLRGESQAWKSIAKMCVNCVS